MKQIAIGLVVPAVLVAALLSELGRTLLFGWFTFIAQTWPRATVNREGVITAVVAVALLIAIIEYLARWYCRAVSQGPEATRRRWRSRWTLAIVVVLVLMFVVGYSAMGLARQLGWVLSSQEPIYQSVPAGSADASKNNLKHVGLGVGWYEDTHKKLPVGGTFNDRGEGLHSWTTEILPFLNYTHKIDLKLPWNHPENAEKFKTVVREMINPELRSPEVFDEQGFGLSHYAANSHVLRANYAVPSQEVTDGRANTLLVGEVNRRFRPWGDPANWRDPGKGINTSPEGFGGSSASRGAQFLMMDGAVRFLSQDIDPAVLKALSTPSGGDN